MNSKYVYVSALLVLAVLVSSVSAADHDLTNKNFKMDVPSDSDFNEKVNTDVNVDDLDMSMELFENKGNTSNDLSMILYLKDSSSDKDMVSQVIDDLKNDGDIVEENNDYFIVKNGDSKRFSILDFDFEDLFNWVSNIIKGIFSQNANIDVKTNDANVKISNESLKVIDSNDTKILLSDNGLEIFDSENGDNVSISTDGINVSSNESGKAENVSVSTDGVNVSTNKSGKSDKVSVGGNIFSAADVVDSIGDADYYLCMKSKNNDQVIVLVGNNLDLMKSIANTVSFN